MNEKLQRCADLYQAAAEGKTLQHRGLDGAVDDVTPHRLAAESWSINASNVDRWRVKPEPQRWKGVASDMGGPVGVGRYIVMRGATDEMPNPGTRVEIIEVLDDE